MLNPMQPDPLARLSARLYVPAVRISEWRNASVSRSPTIEVQGTPDADALYLQYAFSAEDRKGRDLEVAWGLHYPEGAEVSTFCSNADENTGTKGETTFSADVSQPEEEHLYYCPGSADVTVVLRGKVKDQVWADVNQVTKSIAFEAPTDFVAATAMGITLVSIPAPGPDNQNVAAVLGESTPKWPPRVTFTSSVDYWDSNWRWDSVTSGVGIPFQKGFVFPRALQEDAEASSLTSSETQKMVFSATMVNPVETQRLQAYRDFALLILGGAFTFTAIYWRPDAPPLAKDAGAGGSQATPRERPATTPDEEITRIGASEDEEPPRSSIGSNDPESRSEASAKGEGEEETGATSKRVEGSE
jgi:hypothetical protein